MNNVRKDKLTRQLEEIAREHLFLEDLDTRNTGEDFQEQAVQSIKNALLAAYELGRQAAKK